MNKKTLFILSQSLGDLLEFSCVVDGYHKKFPNEELYLMTKSRYFYLFEDHPFLKLENYPDPFYEQYFQDPNVLKYSMMKKFNKIFLVNDKLLDFDFVHENIFDKGISREEYYAQVVGLSKEQIGEVYFPEFFNVKENVEELTPQVIIHTSGSKFTGTGWTGFQELVNELNKKGKICIQVGGKEDKLLENVIDRRNILYKDLLELIYNCECFVGIDSFIMHICAEMGKKGVVLFGNTYKPYALHNVGDLIPIIAEKNCTDKFPCHLPTCKMNKKCINNIKVEDVLEKLK